MSEITYDALRKRLAAAEAKNAQLREAIEMAIDCLEDCDVIGAKQTLAKALGEKE